MKKLEVAEQKGLQDVLVFQLCEDDAVAAYSFEEAKSWYQELTGLTDEELYKDEDVEIVSLERRVRKGESQEGMISVKEIVDTYWNGEPFIALTTGGY